MRLHSNRRIVRQAICRAFAELTLTIRPGGGPQRNTGERLSGGNEGENSRGEQG